MMLVSRDCRQRTIPALCLRLALMLCLAAAASAAAQTYIPATRAFDEPEGCSDTDLHVDHDVARSNPEWKMIIVDPSRSILNQPPTVLEGSVHPPSTLEQSGDQAPAEVAEEDLPWNHFTHDFTFKVTPDVRYQGLMSSWANPSGETCPDGTTSDPCHHIDMEVEWENASLMDESEGFNRIWGAVPEFVWPAVSDRVWVAGHWVFDCGHPSSPNGERLLVKYSTEIHPPRALVTFRRNHPALDSFPVPRVSAPNFPGPQSYLPVTGEPAILPPDAANSGPTNVPLTEADVFISGYGGGTNDLCSVVPGPCPGHTGPILPVDEYNYAFDIYPPGTNYDILTYNKNFTVTPPVPDASLQWRRVPHQSELPTHACGDQTCFTVEPIFCLVDDTAPPLPQDLQQIGNDCHLWPVPDHPTRLRVILPFKDHPEANYFAESILLGWDDVPAPSSTPTVRTFKVRLEKLTVEENGEGSTTDGDWRVFVNVGGQWRYMSPLFDRNPDGSNACNGTALTENGDGDCFQFHNTPWTVSVTDGTGIHVAVGGYESDPIDGGLTGVFDGFCRNYPGGCDPGVGQYFGLYAWNDDRIGTFEFDLEPALTNYAPPGPFTTEEPVCHPDYVALIIPLRTCDELRYTTEFSVAEVPAATPPASNPLQIGDPHFGNYFSSATPFTLSSSDPNTKGFQYRFHNQGLGALLPNYSSPLPFPVHWANNDFASGSTSMTLHLNDTDMMDGPYDFQYSANSFANLLEPRHSTTVTLDNTPPITTIAQPAPTQYLHSSSLTLNYAVSDGSGSGVKAFTPKMDAATALPDGKGLASGQMINLLTELTLGSHTFSVDSIDNVGNSGTNSVTFSIIVTPDSIKDDVRQFLQSGALKNKGQANSLLSKLDAAAAARARGQCSTAGNIYQAFINELRAQSGKGVDATAAAIMIADAQYLIAHCPVFALTLTFES